jgi:protein TonB
MDKKAILWPVIVSISIHVTLLAAAGMIDLTGKITPMDVLSVSIKEPDMEEKKITKKEVKIKKKAKALSAQKNKETATNDDKWREDTIELGSTDIKYSTYLAKIKKRLLSIWKYPQKAFEKKEEGDVVVKMSIDSDGSLASATLLSSSGSVDLDDGALNVILQAAPYEPLPEIYNLSRLNIIASFNYKIMD